MSSAQDAGDALSLPAPAPLVAGPPSLSEPAAAEGSGPTGEVFATAVAGGDEETVAAAVRYHLPRLARYLARLGGDPGLAEDVAQESLLRAVLACRRGRPPVQLGPWLYAVATNLWRDAARSAERRHTTLGLSAEAPGGDDPAARWTEAEVLRAALRLLPPELGAVLVLHFYEGLALREIAPVTGAPLGTVKWRMFTALRRMRGLLGPACGRTGEGEA